MKTTQKIALIYLIAVGFMTWGFVVGEYHVFPYKILREVQDYVKGDSLGKDTSVFDKAVNDLGLQPNRHLREYPANAEKGARFIEVPGLKSRREKPMAFIAADHRAGYRVVFGAFDFTSAFWGGILLSPTGETIHTWKLSTKYLKTSIADDELKVLYGLHLFPDGSIIFTQQEAGGGIVKVDACGNIQWSLEGNYHHTISPTEDGDFWTFAGRQTDFDHKLTRISQETGEIKAVIDMADVRKANPFLHIFNLQSLTGAINISHGNDIEPLSSKLAQQFQGLEAGDLLITYRTQNLVFVLDPDTLKVKWWRIGPWDRPHDADWEINGTVAVFSNNDVTGRRHSDIVAIDPRSFESEVIVDGDKFNFHSRTNGEHQRSDFGTRMITSTNQGWAFEVDQDNKIVFSFINTYDRKKHSSLSLSEAQRLPRDYFDEEFWKQCSE